MPTEFVELDAFQDPPIAATEGLCPMTSAGRAFTDRNNKCKHFEVRTQGISASLLRIWRVGSSARTECTPGPSGISSNDQNPVPRIPIDKRHGKIDSDLFLNFACSHATHPGTDKIYRAQTNATGIFETLFSSVLTDTTDDHSKLLLATVEKATLYASFQILNRSQSRKFP